MRRLIMQKSGPVCPDLSGEDRKGGVALYRHGAFIREVSRLPAEEVWKLLRTTPCGVTADEAEARLHINGPNEIIQKENPRRRQLLKAFINLFTLLLLALGWVCYLNDLKGAAVMVAMVLGSVCLTFFQARRPGPASHPLRALVGTQATVTRRTGYVTKGDEAVWITKRLELPIRELVRGDLLHLSAGDMIPGDVRLLTSKDLFVSQAVLTGELGPVKKVACGEDEERNLVELQNICFMGSRVVSGTATAIVVKTGADTLWGSMAGRRA